MPTILDSLFVRLGFKADASGLEGFAKRAEEAKGIMFGLSAAIAGAVAGITHMIHSTAERMGGIQEFSDQMGMGAREVAALGKVARENESSLEAMEGGIRGLAMMAIQADKHLGRGATVFKKFGLEARDSSHHLKTADVLLGEVAGKMEGMSVGERNLLGTRLGFDPATILLLSKGRENFQKLRADALAANPFSEADYEAGHATEKAFRKAGDAVERLKNRLAVGLFPTVQRLIERFSAWTKDENNIAKIQQAINKVVEVAELLWKHADKILAVFALFYAHKYGSMFIEWGASLMKVAGGLGKGAAAAELFHKGLGVMRSILTGGLMALLLLVAEDLWIFHQGGESLTGWMLERFPYAVEVMKGALAVLSGALVALTTGSGPLGLLIVGIGGFIIAAQDLKNSWSPVMQWFEEVWDSLADKVAKFWNITMTPLRYLAKLAGIDLTMDENHAAMRNAEFNADHRAMGTVGPRGPAERAAYAGMANRAGGMLPGFGTISPFIGLDTYGTQQLTIPNQTTVGAMHLHIEGATLKADESEKLFRAFSEKLRDRGLMDEGRARGKTRDAQTGHR